MRNVLDVLFFLPCAFVCRKPMPLDKPLCLAIKLALLEKGFDNVQGFSCFWFHHDWRSFRNGSGGELGWVWLVQTQELDVEAGMKSVHAFWQDQTRDVWVDHSFDLKRSNLLGGQFCFA